MRTITSARALLATLAVAVACLGVPAAADASFVVGAQSDNMLIYNDNAGREAELDRLDAIGVQMVRVTMSWKLVAANTDACATATVQALTDPDHACYNWSTYDHLVSEASARGLPLVFSIFQIPHWVLGKEDNWTGRTDATFDLVVKPRWAAFARAAAARYNASSSYGYVRRWTVGNEPNSAFFWQPKDVGAPKRYARLYREAAYSIRQASPGAKIAVGPTGPRSTMKPGNWWRLALPVLVRNGSGRYIDAVGHNTYPSAPRSPRWLKTNPPSLDVTNMRDLYRILDGYSVTRHKKVWVLEFAYQTNPPDHIFGASWTNQASWLAEGWDIMNDGRVQMALWYVMRDPTASVDWQSGLWTASGVAKPSRAMYMRPVARDMTTIRRGQTVRLFGMSLVRPGSQTLKYSYNGSSSWRTVPGQRRSGNVSRASWRPRRNIYVRVVDPAGAGPSRLVRVS